MQRIVTYATGKCS